MREGENHFDSVDSRLDRALVIINSILTVVSIIVTVISIVITVLFR